MTYDYTCPKCGSKDVITRAAGRRMGVYCAKCNAFIAWVGYKQMMKLNRELRNNLPENMAIKQVYKSKSTGVIRWACSKCNCLLYTSTASAPEGQFNLSAAKFCPLCGREFV